MSVRMKFVPMKKLMHAALQGGYAVPSFCVWNAETMATVLRTAQEMRSPVILMNGPCEFKPLPPPVLFRVAQSVASDFDVKAAFLLDHGNALAQAAECIDAGYTSVMLDFSMRSFAENAAALRQVVALARPRGVTVEGEIGHVGRVDEATAEGTRESTLTDPADAVIYMKETGVDALAVSIGNSHGQYTRLPRFDFDRLAAIRKVVSVPLVLHGGSGTPDDDLKRAISLGIAKINVATDVVTAVRESLRRQWDGKKNLWAPMAMAEAMTVVADVVRRWILRTGAEGKA